MSGSGGTRFTRLSPEAWDALLEALAVFTWFKSDFEPFVRRLFGDAPELVQRISFTGTKREVASDLVAELERREQRYQDIVLDVLVTLSKFDDRFPKLARLEDGAEKVGQARAALAEVRRIVRTYAEHVEERARLAKDLEQADERAALRRTHADVLERLRVDFIALQSEEPHKRGKAFEVLLNDLFGLYDLYPRAAYDLSSEQIDGAFTFQNADFLLEAKWWKSALEPAELHVFDAKIRSKAKHTLGLFVAVNGFTSGAIEKYSHATALILFDGADLYPILEGRISLTEVLERKRRHAAETGIPMLPVSKMIG